MIRWFPLTLLLALSLSAQNPDPHAGKVPHCDNYFNTKVEERCDCNKANTCPNPDAPLPEEQKCKSYCFHGCGCLGPCDT